MKNIHKLWKLTLTTLIALFMIAAPATLADSQSNPPKKLSNYENEIQEAIDQASNYMIEKGVMSEWEAIGLAQAGKIIPDTYADQFYNHVENQITKGFENGRVKITDIERLAMAAVAIGKDPQDILDHNLIELIYNSPDRNGDDTMTFQGNNGPIFALIALDTLDFDVPKNARWNREKLIDELLSNQNNDGSWPLNNFFDTPDIDITAMAMIALSTYTEQLEVEEALNKTLNYLSEEQTDDGGYDGGSFVGGITSEAASQVIIGLTAYGIDPTSDDFTENGVNLIDHLLSYQFEDGGFKHTRGENDSNAMATEQALQALVAYQYFIQDKGSLYDFNAEEETPKDPEEPKDPVAPENPDDEEEIELKEGETKTVKVSKGETKSINNNEIKLPDDLPSGTELIVTNPKKVNNLQDIKQSGDVLDFQFKLPADAEESTGLYKLTMKVNPDHAQKSGIYYYNDKSKLWEYVGGANSVNNGVITVEVDHFSRYGVFSDLDDPTDVTFDKINQTETNVEFTFSAKDDSGIEQFIITRNNKKIARLSGDESTYIDEDVKAGESYEYQLIAVDPMDNQTSSSKITVKIAADKEPKHNESNNADNDNTKSDELDSAINQADNKSKVESQLNEAEQHQTGEKLPKTATNMYTYLVIGLLLLVLGGIVFYVNRKRQHE